MAGRPDEGPGRASRTTFAERLNLLFATRYPPGSGPYTSGEVIRELGRTGATVSAPYLSQLRSGTRSQPSNTTIIALAEVFGVSSAYFTDDDHHRVLAIELIQHAQLRDPGVRQIGERLCGLSPEALDEIARYVEELWHRDRD